MAAPAGAFPADYAAGHFVLVGPTGSGKTYYAKYILKGRLAAVPGLRVFVFVSPVSAHDWREAEADGRPLVPAEAVRTSWEPEAVALLYDEIRTAGAGLIVFDDFKGQLDYHSNKDFKELWRVLRHLNAQVMAIGHTPNDVPPVVRENVTHCILTFTSNRDVVKALAATYLAGDVPRLDEALRRLAGHAVVKINARRNAVDVHAASGVSTSAVGCGGGAPGAGAGGGASLQIGGPSVAGASVGMKGRGDVAVHGTYNDASTTNQFLRLEENLVAQQRASALALRDMRARSRAARALEVEGVAHARALEELRENQEAFALLHKAFPSPDERARVAAILAQRLGDAGVTALNYRARGADRAFMEAFFPGRPYAPPPAALHAGGLVVPRLVAGDLRGLAGDLALDACAGGGTGVAAAARDALGFCRGLLRGGAARAPPAPAAAPAAKTALRIEIRRLAGAHLAGALAPGEKTRFRALLSGAYRRGGVGAENETRVALEFLAECFPADLEALRAARRHPTAAAPAAPAPPGARRPSTPGGTRR